MRARVRCIAVAGLAAIPALALPGAASPQDPADDGCPVTVANGRSSPGAERQFPYHGNGRLWFPLGNARFTAYRQGPGHPARDPLVVQDDGSIRTKYPWNGGRRTGPRLRLTGRRLDGDAPRLRARGRRMDYSRPGHRFWPTPISFPSEGCWRITARSGHARLRFTVAVRIAE